MSSILVVASLLDGALSRSSLELVGAARVLSGPLGLRVCAALLGQGTGMAQGAETLQRYGAEMVFRCEHPLLVTGQSEAVLIASDGVARQAQSQVVLLTADTVGREVAPRLAYRLRAVLATEVMSLDVDGQVIVARRQVYAGRAIATLALTARPAVCSIKPRAFEVPPEAPVRGSIEDVSLSLDEGNLRVRVREVQGEKAAASLEDAEVVVGGGRGMGGPEGFALLGALAEVLGGAVGASRPPADEGWVPITWQIGQTGKSIRPSLYVAVGISGAAQHVAGVSGARTIVAINKDAEAPIFSLAHYGIVGDYRQVVPALIARLKDAKGA